MRAIVKNLAPELVPSPAQSRPMPALFLNDLLARMTIVDPNEIGPLSAFFPLVVLIPKSYVKDPPLPAHIASSKPSNQASEAAKVLGLFENAVEQLKSTNVEDDFVFGGVTVNFSTMEAHHMGQPVALTIMEFKTLQYLIRNQRRVISRDELLNQVWGYENYPCTRTVDNHILKLRQKLERDPSRPLHFRTVHGAGYKFLP
jgi:Transcriptional regulatory protein, C terminal